MNWRTFIQMNKGNKIGQTPDGCICGAVWRDAGMGAKGATHTVKCDRQMYCSHVFDGPFEGRDGKIYLLCGVCGMLKDYEESSSCLLINKNVKE